PARSPRFHSEAEADGQCRLRPCQRDCSSRNTPSDKRKLDARCHDPDSLPEVRLRLGRVPGAARCETEIEMKFPELLNALQRPLLIKPSAHASYLKLFEDHIAQPRAEFNAEREGTDWCGKAIEIDQAETINGICYVPIGGPLGKGLGSFEKGAGCVDYQDITDELTAFEEDDRARAAILVFDSPGGMCQGLTSCRDRILACDKPVHSYSDGMICSAAYALACATDA